MSLRTAALLVALSVGCGPSAPGVYPPGITGPAHTTRIEIVAVDEDTHVAIDAFVFVASSDGTFAREEEIFDLTLFEDAGLPASAWVRAETLDAYERTEVWFGVTGARLVIPVARRERPTITGVVHGVAAIYGDEVKIGALTNARLMRGDLTAHATASTCAPAARGDCTFTIAAPSASGPLVASILDGGRVIAFARTDAVSGSAVIELADPAMIAPPLTLAVPLPVGPPGLEAVVGVPGLASQGAIAFLPSSDDGFVVPELELGETWWIIAEATALADSSRRSVVLQRSLRALGDVGAWPEWLEVPSVTVVDASRITVAPTPGADLLVVEWLDATGRVSTTQTVLDASVRSFSWGGGESDPTSVRVRAIEADGVSGESLDVDALERSIVRFSEVTISLSI